MTSESRPKSETVRQSFGESNIPGKVKVRFSNENDVDRVMSFYLSNPHPGYAPREVTPERIKDGHAIIVEDEGGQIWGASVSYTLNSEVNIPENGTHSWSEIGTTRIILNGCGLYPFMIASQALMVHFEDAPNEFIYADIHTTNEGVIALLNGKLQWPEIDPPDDLHDRVQSMLADDKKGIPANYYKCGVQQLPHQAQTVLDVIDNDGATHKSGQKILFDFSEFPLFSQYLERLKELAALSGQEADVTQVPKSESVDVDPPEFIQDH